MKSIPFLRFACLVLLALTVPLRAAGTLTPVGSDQPPLQIRSHEVKVTLNNGFAQTEVRQTFFNPGPADLEAVYAFPVPRGASLAEVTIQTGEKTLQGEVLARAEAQEAYEAEKKAGRDAGLAVRNGYSTHEFRVAPVRAQAEVHLRFVYFQPLEIDAGVGRYVYPLEDGGTDEAAQAFWTANPRVDGRFSVDVELKSAWPVSEVRVPGQEGAAVVQRQNDGHYRVTLERTGALLDRDFVLYYRLADNLPGRIEVIPYRAAADRPGTFMMVVTPGIDLRPLTRGSDHTFVLDVSGSMRTKLPLLARGIAAAVGQLSPQDRFRIITFNQSARELLPWTPATRENVAAAIAQVGALEAKGGTNLHAGVALGLRGLDDDRASSVILVTDGVANVGLVRPADFRRLLQDLDVRVFGFLLGNGANWPLLRTIADTSGGFYAGVSNADDLAGQLILAKGKVTHEALHHATVSFRGPANVTETTADLPRKIFRGQQLVIFGRYERAGPATVTLQASLTGEDRTYTTTVNLPEVDAQNPEIERLWAMARIEQVEAGESAGLLPAAEAQEAVRRLGVAYQLVTDHTAMVVLDDEAHARRGIARNNQARVTLEQAAQAARATQPARMARVDAAQPAFPGQAAHVSQYRGGGDLGGDAAFLLALGLLLAAGTWFGRCGRAGARGPRQ